MSACPCGAGPEYGDCCGRFHQGGRASTPLELMRSRYAAYALGLVDYLAETRAPSKRRPDEAAALARSMDRTRWTGLSIVETTESVVEFIARYESDEGPGELRERSKFILEDGVWYYLDGTYPSEKKIGRNEPCPCGSGRKYKKCCGGMARS